MKKFMSLVMVVLLSGCLSPSDRLEGDYYGKNADGEVSLKVSKVDEGQYVVSGILFGEVMEPEQFHLLESNESISLVGVSVDPTSESVIGSKSSAVIFGKIDPTKSLLPSSVFQESGYGGLTQGGNGYFALVLMSALEMRKQ